MKVPIAELAAIAALGGSIVWKALAGKIAIPDFEWFCEHINNIFDEVRMIDDGEPAVHIPQLVRDVLCPS